MAIIRVCDVCKSVGVNDSPAEEQNYDYQAYVYEYLGDHLDIQLKGDADLCKTHLKHRLADILRHNDLV